MTTNKKRKPNRENYAVKKSAPSKTSGIEPVKNSSTRQKCVVSYCTFGILGLFFFFNKKNNNYVRFNGLQAALMNLSIMVLVTILLRFLPYMIPSAVFFLLILLDLMAVVKCRKYQFFKYSYFGELAEVILLKKYL